jgi:hypothetical protein
MQWIGIVSSFTRVWVRAVPEQQFYNFQLSTLGCNVQAGPAGVLSFRVACPRQTWIVGKQVAQHCNVTLGAGLKEGDGRFGLPLLDLSFQGAPTREAMISRYGQLSGGKLCVGISVAKLL